MYGLELSVLSEEIILLIRPREPALELCRLANIGDSEKASLETICILSLPVISSNAWLQWVGTTEEKPDHALFSKNHQQHLSPHSHPLLTTTSGTGSSTLQPEGRIVARLRSVTSDGIVNVVMQVNSSLDHCRLVDVVIRRRTLLEFATRQAQVGATDAPGLGVKTVLMLPWEAWGPTNTRILAKESYRCGGHSGERRATALMSRITMRDYNPHRVRRALTLLGGAGKEVTLACGSVVKVVKEASVYPGGECFCDDIETSLPYVETVTSYDRCDDISMDESYLVAEVFTTVSHVHLCSSIKALSDERPLSRQVNESFICIHCDTTYST